MGLLDGPAMGGAAPAVPPMGATLAGAAAAVVPATTVPADAQQVEADAFVKILAKTSTLPDRTEVALFLQAQ
eukprot:7109477-Prymnesium_polylepis.1